ncbi:Glutathione-dependent formaldehyde-activating GFA [Burkholderia multivorans]
MLAGGDPAACEPDREAIMLYRGSCHCGNVKFEVEGELKGALSCNCSICSRTGSLLWFAPRANLHLQTPEENLATYMFNKHVIQHRFCKTCGIHPFAEGTDPQGNRMAAVNIRCLEGVDIDAVPVTHYDGRSR